MHGCCMGMPIYQSIDRWIVLLCTRVTLLVLWGMAFYLWIWMRQIKKRCEYVKLGAWSTRLSSLQDCFIPFFMQKQNYSRIWIVNYTIDTIPYDTGLEAPFVHSLYAVYFHKSTPCCLARLTFEPEPWLQVGKFRPNFLLMVALLVLITNVYEE